MKSWLEQTLIPLGAAAVGVGGKIAIDYIMRTKKGVRIEVLEHLDRISGALNKYGSPTTTIRRDSLKAQYFVLTVQNHSRRETALRCLPELFFVTTTEKIHTVGFWFTLLNTVENDLEEYTLSIYQRCQEPLICLVSVSHKLRFYDSTIMAWGELAGDGDGDLHFKMVVSLKASNCKICTGRNFDLRFDAENETIEIQQSHPVDFVKENPSRYFAKL